MIKEVFVIILAVLIVGAVLLIQQPSAQVIARQEPRGFDEFKVFTAGECEDRGDSKFCQDKIFYSCNGVVQKAEGDFVTCGNRSIELNKVNLGSLEIAKQ